MVRNIILTELYNKHIHNPYSETNPSVEGHYLVIGKFTPYTYHLCSDEDVSDEDDEYIESEDCPTIFTIATFYRTNYNKLINSSLPQHPIIRNYNKIIRSKNYFTPQIGICIVLPTLETVAIIKTIWIKIIQRTWKKIYKHRKQMLYSLIVTNKYQLSNNIMQKLPNIRGMLYNINTKKNHKEYINC